jgi:hypothetical protein
VPARGRLELLICLDVSNAKSKHETAVERKHIHNYTTPFPEIFAVDLSGFTFI